MTNPQPEVEASVYGTRRDAEQTVSTVLGKFVSDHDVPAIADALFEVAGSWDVEKVGVGEFWEVVEAHRLVRHSDLACSTCGRTTYWCSGHDR